VQAMGATSRPDALVEKLMSLGLIKYRVGIVHGDLHGRNVQTRAHDAILLDFYSTCPSQPLAFDPAYLEITTAFSHEAHYRIGDGWAATVDDLYQVEKLTIPPPPDIQAGASNWLRNIIRQIRVFAIANIAGTGEYARVLAYVLLRHATFLPKDDPHAAERAHAYVVAERLISQLQ